MDLGTGFLVLDEALLCRLIVRLHQGLIKSDQLLHLLLQSHGRRNTILLLRHSSARGSHSELLVLLLQLEKVLLTRHLGLVKRIASLIELSSLACLVHPHEFGHLVQTG